MAHEVFRLASATPEVLDLAMVGLAVLLGVGLPVLIWTSRSKFRKSSTSKSGRIRAGKKRNRH